MNHCLNLNLLTFLKIYSLMMVKTKKEEMKRERRKIPLILTK
jgi:hypothetical protein